MELLGILIGLALAGFIFIVPIIALVRASLAARKIQQSQENWQKLTQRVYALEAQLKELQDRFNAQAVVLEQALKDLRIASTVREGPAPAAAAPPEPPKPRVLIKGAEAPPPEPPRPAATIAPSAPAVAPGQPDTATPIAPPHFEMSGTQKPLSQETVKRVLNMEEVLGTDWLNKLGMSILVIGVAFFLAYEMRELGPAGKVLVGYVVSASLLGAGIFYERLERYRVLARVGIGGGWALTFFTTYAMYHIAPARVLNSQILDLFLLLSVTAVMVAHTLRYNSQVVTGLALLLAYGTVTISHDNVYSLSAGAILALALVIIVSRRGWFELEIFGILSSYLNHYYWLRHIIEPMDGHRHPFPEFYASAALLLFYWLVFRSSYLLRRPAQAAVEHVSTVAALLNTFLLLSVMKYQSIHPEWAFRFLLVLGAAEFTLGQLPIARRRRSAFLILSTIGATLMVAALPFKYSGATLPILWLAEAEALFLAGVFTREIVFRRLGLLAALLVAFQMDHLALGQIFDSEWKGFHAGDWLRGVIVFTTTVLVFYIDAQWLPQRRPDLRESRLEMLSLRVLSYAAGATAFIGIWWLAPEAWAAVGFAALAMALSVLASRTASRDFLYQANAVAILAFFRVLFVNLGQGTAHGHFGTRLETVGLVAALLYGSARWSGLARTIASRRVSVGLTWAASFLLGLLAWYELRPVSVAVAWTLMGLALFEIGRARRLPYLRVQAYLAFAFSFLRLFFVNFNATGLPGELSPRFYTTVPLALAFFYVYRVLDTSSVPALDPDRRWKAAEGLCFLGTFTLAGWARFELEADWVVAAWAAMIWALLAIAWRYKKSIFLHQGLLLGAAVLMRATLHNFYERSYFPAPVWQSRSLTVGLSTGLLFAALPFAFRLRRSREDGLAKRGLWRRVFNAFERRPEQVLFFIPFFLLTVLLALEVPKGMVTVAWGVEAVSVFLFALAAGQRSYRLSGLGLLLLCVGKIMVLDVWGLQPRDRYLTFIVLGTALLGVSFLYTRYREAIRQYL